MAWTRTWRRTVEEDVKGKERIGVAEDDAEQNPGGMLDRN